jgi:hypothetical protein
MLGIVDDDAQTGFDGRAEFLGNHPHEFVVFALVLRASLTAFHAYSLVAIGVLVGHVQPLASGDPGWGAQDIA